MSLLAKLFGRTSAKEDAEHAGQEKGTCSPSALDHGSTGKSASQDCRETKPDSRRSEVEPSPVSAVSPGTVSTSRIRTVLKRKDLEPHELLQELASGGSAEIPDLLDVVRTDYVNMRVACEAIAKIGDSAAVEPLSQLMSKGNPSDLARPLCQLVDSSHIGLFANLLGHAKHWRERAGGALVLGELVPRARSSTIRSSAAIPRFWPVRPLEGRRRLLIEPDHVLVYAAA